MDGSIPGAAPERERLHRQFCDTVHNDLNTLARLHHAEADDELLSDLGWQQFPGSLGLRLITSRGLESVAFMRQAMAEFTAPLSQAQRDELAVDYAAIYLNHAIGVAPCESVWLDEENLAMQAPMFQVREIYRRHGLGVIDWRTRADDHLVVELQFLAWLARKGGEDNWREAACFMDEHLLRWLPKFGERVAKRCATPLYAAAAWLTWTYCDELRDVLADILGEARPSAEAVEARMNVHSTTPAPLRFMPGMAPSW